MLPSQMIPKPGSVASMTMPMEDNNEMDDKDGEEEPKDLILVKLEYSTFSKNVTDLINHFDTKIKPRIEANRNRRRLDTDSEALRNSGDLAQDETFIPIRVIDQNIMAELPPLVNYIVSPARVAIFKDKNNAEVNDKKLESGFTTCVKYPGWIHPIYRLLDGAGAHGYSVLEIGYAENQPGKFELYDVGAGDFLFPEGTIDIQAAPICGIRLPMTCIQLEALKDQEGFNKEGITQALEKLGKDKKFTEKLDVFKIFVKCEGVVYVLWYLKDINSAWLREPMQHDVGIWEKKEQTIMVQVPSVDSMSGQQTLIEQPQINYITQPVPLNTYPVFIYPYALTENKSIDDFDGRAMKDAAVQEAMTALWSTNVNGTARASNIYAAPEGEVEPGTPIELLDVTLKSGSVYSRKMQFFSTPYPSDTVIRSIQALDGKNKESTGQLAATVNNRQDSRKTAAESKIAKEQESNLDSVSILLLSVFIGEVYNFAWKIVQSQAILGNIIIYPAEVQQTPGMMPAIDIPPTNDLSVISKEYILYPAGDADYIQLEERKEQYATFWPMVSNFPGLREMFLADMLKDTFKSNGDRYAKVLEGLVQEPQMKGLATNLFMMLEELIKNPAVHNLPEVQQAIPGLEQIKQLLTGGNENGQPQENQQPQ